MPSRPDASETGRTRWHPRARPRPTTTRSGAGSRSTTALLRPCGDTGGSEDPGILRIDFPGGAGADELEQIDWDEWFRKFDESGLAFLYQEQKASGEDSTFFKLVNR
jgi:hypothetical protein